MKRLKPEKWIWWKHGVFYHIYVRSFFDSDNDGIGDLTGIVKKLDYLEKLGIDAIWLSPVFESPQVDFGYDVSDYKQIDPLFGDIGDFKKLLKEAHKRDIKVIIDFILNHTSDEHPWFLESSSSIGNPKRNWYIWHDGTNGKIPNNWKTCFGGSAWQYHKETNQYYYHSFFKEQPDLNWRDPGLKKEFFNIIDYWLRIGVDGFRLDVANLIVKDKKYRDNPGFFGVLNGNQKLYTRNRPRSLKILQDLRKILNRYDERMSIGEIYTLPPGDPELAASYLGNGKDTLHLAFDFSLMFKPWNAKIYAKTIDKWINTLPEKGWPCHVLSNHDLMRSYNRRFINLFKQKKAVISAFLLLTLKGSPFIYYGEEIGMENTRVKPKDFRDPLSKKFWPLYSGRDKARTPMQWNDSKNAGFTRYIPWLPLNKNFKKVNVKTQEQQQDSLLYFYKHLLKLRKKHTALQSGSWKLIVKGKKGVLAYKRESANDNLIVFLNFKPFSRKIRTENYRLKKVILSTHKNRKIKKKNKYIKLKPFEAVIFKLGL